jgi:hypothetical protein
MEQRNLSKAFFKARFDEMRQRVTNTPLTSENFPSSGAGAIHMAKALLGRDLQYAVIDAVKIEDVRLGD